MHSINKEVEYNFRQAWDWHILRISTKKHVRIKKRINFRVASILQLCYTLHVGALKALIHNTLFTLTKDAFYKSRTTSYRKNFGE